MTSNESQASAARAASEEGMMPEQEEAALQGTWERVNSDDIRVGDRVRADELVDRGISVGEGEVVRVSRGYIHLAERTGGWSKLRSWERWVPAESPARDLPAWSPVELSDLAVSDRVRVTHFANEGSVHEGVITALSCTTGTRPAVQVTDDSGVLLCLHEGTWSFERRNPVPEPAIPAERWESVTDFSTLRAGDHLRSEFVQDPGYGMIEGTFSRLSRNGRVMLDERPGAQYFTDGTRTWEKRVAAPSEPMPVPEVVLAAPRVGDRFTRVFNWTGFLDRPGCTVRTVREVGDAPGQTLWAITYDDAEGWYWANELLVRPDGTCNPNQGPTDRQGRDVTGRYVPEVAAEPVFVPIPASELREGMYVRGTPKPSAFPGAESLEGHITRVDYENNFISIGGDGDPDTTREIALRDWERRVTPEQDATVQAPAQQATGWVSVSDLSELRRGDVVRAEPNGIGGLMQAEVMRTYRTYFTARTTHVIAPSSNGTLDREVDYYYGDILPFEVWRGVTPAPAPEQSTPATVAATPLPDWATSLDAAKRHVHAEVQRLWTGRGGENCSDGSNDVLRGLSLPRVDQTYPAPPDETEEIRSFLAQVREVSLNVADRHGKNRRTVERWLGQNGIVEPPPPSRMYTRTFVAPHDADVDQVLRGLGWDIRPAGEVSL